ncbi:type III pantothenate kinase [Lysobacter brunescens]|uniref:Type III pantothenate kinase n=1 Tax=Lysobacter brunescens TaxID=262323 RepID=A0ABW2YBF8_9GAMM
MSSDSWLFDLGNTRLKYAPLCDGRPGDVTAIAHDGADLPEGWDAALPPRFEAAALTMVGAQALRMQLLGVLTARCARLSIARTVARLDGLRIAYPIPEHLGTDRFLALLGTRRRGPGPWLVVGIGTAITLDLVDADGLHHGGRIAPSPALMREALHGKAAQLPEHGGAFVAFADDTRDALRSGCDGAALALIEQGLRDAVVRIGRRPALLLHGGGVDALDGLDPAAARAPHLVLEGLAAWAGPVE